MIRELEAALRHVINASPGPAGREPVLLAVSGGMDSMALLHMTVNLIRRGGIHVQPVVAHLNHGLRGDASDADQALVERTAGELMVPLEVERVALAPEPSIEDRARRARRGFLARVAARQEASFVLLAHHANDQAETVLDRVLAGAGPDGLRGMVSPSRLPESTARDVYLMRPWLTVPRDAIRRYVEQHGLPYREDATNQDPTRRRNRLRHVVIPFLIKEGNPDLVRSLVRTSGLLAEASEVVRAAADQALEQVRLEAPARLAWLLDRQPGELVCLDRRAFRALAPALRAPVLRAAVRALRPEAPPLPGEQRLRDWIGQLIAPDRGGLPHRIRRGLHAVLDARVLVLARRPLAFRPPPHPALSLNPACPGPIRYPFRELEVVRQTSMGKSATDPDGREPRTALRLDADQVPDQLVLRAALAEDRFCPTGAAAPMRLARYLKKRGVPALARRTTLVVAESASSDVLGVLDQGASAQTRVTAGTRAILTLLDRTAGCDQG